MSCDVWPRGSPVMAVIETMPITSSIVTGSCACCESCSDATIAPTAAYIVE